MLPYRLVSEPSYDIKHLYSKRTTKDGIVWWERKPPSLIKNTFEYFVSHTWGGLKSRCINTDNAKAWSNKSIANTYLNKGIRLELTAKQWKDFCKKNKELIQSLYSQGKTPSIDRIDSNNHYCLSNIRILELKENIKRTHDESRRGIYGVNIETLEEISFETFSEASINGFNKSSIHRAIKDTNKIYKNFIWRYKDGTSESKNGLNKSR